MWHTDRQTQAREMGERILLMSHVSTIYIVRWTFESHMLQYSDVVCFIVLKPSYPLFDFFKSVCDSLLFPRNSDSIIFHCSMNKKSTIILLWRMLLWGFWSSEAIQTAIVAVSTATGYLCCVLSCAVKWLLGPLMSSSPFRSDGAV